MTMRDKVSWVSLVFRLWIGLIVLVLFANLGATGIGIVPAVICAVYSGQYIRSVILPVLMPVVACPGCRRSIPLVGRWKCGGHYTDHTERHVLSFFCPEGHRLGDFNCPRCDSTILVQYGDPKLLRHGSAIRLRPVSNLAGQEGLILGRDEHRRDVQLSSEQVARHLAAFGTTGSGKSTMLSHVAGQLVESGEGVTVLDPGGDLVRAILRRIPPEREQDVLFVDVANRKQPFPLNILHATTAVEQAVLTEELIGVFQNQYGSSWGPVLEHQLRMGLRAVMAAGGTLHHLNGMFNDGKTRSYIIQRVADRAVRDFWLHEFPAIPAIRRSAVTNKLSPILLHPYLSKIIAARQCALNADVIIRERKIVLVSLATGSAGSEVTEILGTFLTQKIMAGAYRQASLPPQHRVPHHLIVDEFQRFMGKAAGFDQILAEARKYKLSLIVANQFVEQLSDSVRAALFGNVGALLSFRVGHRDARTLEHEFIGCIRDDLLDLKIGECLARIGVEWTKLRCPPPLPPLDDDPTERITTAMSQLVASRSTPQPRRKQPPAKTRRGKNDEYVR